MITAHLGIGFSMLRLVLSQRESMTVKIDRHVDRYIPLEYIWLLQAMD